MNTVAVIDYGMGNLHSVAKALEHVPGGHRVLVTSDATEIGEADRVVLPGVGAMRGCMAELKKRGLDRVVRQVVADRRPLLGVCVGMQALLQRSAENDGTECLGVFDGTVEAFPDDLSDAITGARLKVPHMGWNQVTQTVPHPLWADIPQDARFYFVHSYYVQPAGPEPIAASTVYGFPFASVLARDTVFAVQFHPEKSQHDGLQLYANFVAWDGQV
ncbi:MAG: imidazole glycerol phosphate synthase subunit HisH [Gammaproteobacteria bacterium]|nr:imidazole glycerol phosphate synthase subunit HisH [Gammaproteobacteria bacterium]MCF6363954.1 imidazole glycerol phosphate synthase subunit HisH [Gammaproteobacteria bacterium]